MEMYQGYSYHIKDSFFDMINDKYLMSNKENGGYRPHFYAIKDSQSIDIFWMIPISSKYMKYKKIYDTKVLQNGRCDTISLGKFAGNQCAFLIQNAFPIKVDYISHIHKINNKPITIHKKLTDELQVKLKTCLNLHKNGIKVFFTDIDKVYKIIN